MTYYELMQRLSVGVAYTHSGQFHADDCFSAALLRLVYPSLQIIRSRNVPTEFPGLIFDAGGGQFYHHQPESEKRKNGISYASFGLLWRCIAPAVWGLDIYRMVDSRFIQPLDAADNGEGSSPIANIIRQMNPQWNEDNSSVFMQAAFERAVGMCYSILQRQIECVQSDLMARPIIQEAIEHNTDGIVELPRHINCINQLAGDVRPKVMLYPTQTGYGNWNVQTIPTKPGAKDYRVPLFPYEKDEEMGVKYRSGFLATCQDYESAKLLAFKSVVMDTKGVTVIDNTKVA